MRRSFRSRKKELVPLNRVYIRRLLTIARARTTYNYIPYIRLLHFSLHIWIKGQPINEIRRLMHCWMHCSNIVINSVYAHRNVIINHKVNINSCCVAISQSQEHHRLLAKKNIVWLRHYCFVIIFCYLFLNLFWRKYFSYLFSRWKDGRDDWKMPSKKRSFPTCFFFNLFFSSDIFSSSWIRQRQQTPELHSPHSVLLRFLILKKRNRLATAVCCVCPYK